MIKEISVEKVFLLISLVFGLIYVLILPPFQSVDETDHFYRGYEIISNGFVAKNVDNKAGDYLPSSLQKLGVKYSFLIKDIDVKTNFQYILDTAKIKLNPEKKEFITFPNTALYSPVCYLTQIPGMYIAKALNQPPLGIFYWGRVSNLLFFVLIIYFAIKLMPFYKLTTMLLALMPMTLSLAGALTSDVMLIGLNFLWVALLLKLLTEKKKQISNSQIFCLILFAFILSLIKDYVLLIPLIFLLPKSKFQNWYRYFTCILGVLVASSLGFLLWQSLISTLSLNMNEAANSAKQISFIINNPIAYLTVLVKTFFVKLPRLIITMIGVLGWQDTRLDFLTYIFYPILIVLSIVSEERTEFRFKKWQIFIIIADVIFSIILIFTTLYLMWSNVASPIIYGLNGKYFTPVMLLFLFLFYNFPKAKKIKNIKLIIYIALILILISSDLSLLHRFYSLTPNLYYNV